MAHNQAKSPRPFSSTRGKQLFSCSKKEEESTEDTHFTAKSAETFNPEIQSFFQICSKHLDQHHDRCERLVKISRDITLESKRVIFLLHRIQDPASLEKISKEAESKLQFITNTLWKRTASELHEQDPYHYLRAYSPGLQEFIEAFSLLHFVTTGNLLTLEEVERRLEFPNNHAVLVPVSEYILGIADLTGELMRLCINSVGRGDVDTCFETCNFLRRVHEALSSLNLGGQRELKRKLQVSRQSLQKVETACYTIQVRGSEVPKETLQLLASQAGLIDEHPTWTEDFD